MKKQAYLLALIPLFFAGCSSAPISDASKPSGPSSELTNDEKDLDLASLRDPNSILSKRSIYFDFDKDIVKAEYKELVRSEEHTSELQSH